MNPVPAGPLQLVQEDITRLNVDAIVNAANNSLLGGGGVDGAIHRAAGPRLLAACRECGGCATGEAKITPGFDLPANYVIHTVGPVWAGGMHGEATLLASCYRNALALARQHEVRTIAFAAISCGVDGYPLAQAAAIAVDTICDTLRDRALPVEVNLVCFSRDVLTAYQTALSGECERL